jgi:hypothetical protein
MAGAIHTATTAAIAAPLLLPKQATCRWLLQRRRRRRLLEKLQVAVRKHAHTHTHNTHTHTAIVITEMGPPAWNNTA